MTPEYQPNRERGVATIEFAIVAPLLLFLVLAVAELSNVLQQYNTLTKSVRDGARYAAGRAIAGSTGVPTLDDSWVNAAKNLAVYGNTAGTGDPLLPYLDTEDVAVTMPDSDHITVSASYAYRPMFNVIPTFGFGGEPIVPNFTLRATVTMRPL